MQAIEFETDVINNIITIPKNYRTQLQNKHIKIFAVYNNAKLERNKTLDEWNKLKNSLGSFDVKKFNPVEWQQNERAMWDDRI